MNSMAGGSRLKKEDEQAKHFEDCLQCLKDSLQLAVALEFSTIPPYLCALWSIKDELDPAAVSIREVVQEEMLHMALACNMLTGIGGTPQISSSPPRYPTPLAGGLHPGLEVGLSGIDDNSLIAFMHIELPDELFDLDSKSEWDYPIPFRSSDMDENSKDKAKGSEGNARTIGKFYTELAKFFATVNPTLSRDNQITGPLAYSNIGDIDGVNWAIELISHQGEGSTKSPFEDDDKNDLAHFYRFEQVYMAAKLEWCPLSKTFYKGDALPRPDSWPMAPTPPGGYKDEHLKGLSKADKATVSYNLDSFDRVYSKLLDQLQSTWTGGGQRTLILAYETMFDLENYAKPLMQIPIPGKDGATFGPCFRYVGDAS